MIVPTFRFYESCWRVKSYVRYSLFLSYKKKFLNSSCASYVLSVLEFRFTLMLRKDFPVWNHSDAFQTLNSSRCLQNYLRSTRLSAHSKEAQKVSSLSEILLEVKNPYTYLLKHFPLHDLLKQKASFFFIVFTNDSWNNLSRYVQQKGLTGF